jgi:hypothetical protein
MVEQTIDTRSINTKVARAGSAMRMRRCRARRRAGFRCVLIEIADGEIGDLVRRGLLSADDREDLDAIQTAVYGFFEQTIGRPS